jgi:hypothetical protein
MLHKSLIRIAIIKLLFAAAHLVCNLLRQNRLSIKLFQNLLIQGLKFLYNIFVNVCDLKFTEENVSQISD